MTKDEALRLAVRALERLACLGNGIMRGNSTGNQIAIDALTAIKAALEAKDEPDKYAMDIECTKCGAKQSGVLTVHTTPTQRKPLTDEEIRKWWASENGLEDCDMCKIDDFILVARAIEAKLKQKNFKE